MIIAAHKQQERLENSTISSLLDKQRLFNSVNANNKLNAPIAQLDPQLQCTCDDCSSRGTLPRYRPPSILQRFGAAVRTNAIVISQLLRNPLFFILCITQVSFTWGWTTYSMVIVDFSVDRGIDFFSAVTLLSAFSGADLVGRLGSGWISDKGASAVVVKHVTGLAENRSIKSFCMFR